MLVVYSLTVVQAGGKEDSAQGVGSNVDRVDDALKAAGQYVA